jgi:hypothetical protein
LACTSSATRTGSRSRFRSAQRYSIVTFWHSIQPSSRRPRRNAACCAPTGVGHPDAEVTDPARSGRLRRGAKRPREEPSGNAANECSPLHHWITSSARSSTACKGLNASLATVPEGYRLQVKSALKRQA